MKFISKIAALLLLVVSFGIASAQPVVYRVVIPSSLRSPDLSSTAPLQLFDRDAGRMVISYRSGGYDAVMNGERLSLTTRKGIATVIMGKLVLTTPVGGEYWHNRVGMWRDSPVTSSYGDRGTLRMFYAGMVPGGRLYRDELWLNGSLFTYGSTMIDHNDQIVWSEATDKEGMLRLERLGSM